MARRMRHRQTKGPETAGPDLNHRATSRLYARPPLFPTCDLGNKVDLTAARREPRQHPKKCEAKFRAADHLVNANLDS